MHCLKLVIATMVIIHLSASLRLILATMVIMVILIPYECIVEINYSNCDNIDSMSAWLIMIDKATSLASP